MFCDCKSNEIIISKINPNKLFDLSNVIDISNMLKIKFLKKYIILNEWIIYFVVVKI